MPFGNKKNYFRESFQFGIVTISKKYNPSGNLQLNNLGIFQSLELRTLVKKILPISLKRNFTPNTWGCFGLRVEVSARKIKQIL